MILSTSVIVCFQGIQIKTPIQWPYNRGFSFSCWLRIENFPDRGIMGLFSFFTENGKGCLAMLAKGTLIFEVTSLVSVKSVLKAC